MSAKEALALAEKSNLDLVKIAPTAKPPVCKIVDYGKYNIRTNCIAPAAIATDMVKGHTIEEALTLSNKAVVEALGGLPAHKIHCSVLAEEAIKAAVADYYKKNGIDKEIPAPAHCHECEIEH